MPVTPEMGVLFPVLFSRGLPGALPGVGVLSEVCGGAGGSVLGEGALGQEGLPGAKGVRLGGPFPAESPSAPGGTRQSQEWVEWAPEGHSGSSEEVTMWCCPPSGLGSPAAPGGPLRQEWGAEGSRQDGPGSASGGLGLGVAARAGVWSAEVLDLVRPPQLVRCLVST